MSLVLRAIRQTDVPRRTVRTVGSLGMLLVLLTWRPSTACGPNFPNQLLLNGDHGILTMPVGDFVAELDALRPSSLPPKSLPPPSNSDRSVYQQSADTDLRELRAAMESGGVATSRINQIAIEYAAFRDTITKFSQARSNAAEKGGPIDAAKLGAIAHPSGLPGEFDDYAKGLAAFHQGNLDAARAAWTALLARPAEQRRLRSTWAAFMLGKSYMDDDAARSRQWFGRTRSLAAEGFADALNLADSSLGWEARVELKAGNTPAAIALYLRQHWSGDPTAATSIRIAARTAFAGGQKMLETTATDEMSRRVIAAYILSEAGPFMALTERDRQLILPWLAAVEAAEARDVSGADRMAWAAYRSGEFASAARWATLAPAGSGVANWVRAKLLLRDGKTAEAAALLAEVVQSFPADDQWLTVAGAGGDSRESVVPAGRIMPGVAGDLAVLHLTRGQYADALDLLLRADFWMDAAYVAERVLTIDELRAFVDRRYPDASSPTASVNAFATNSRANRAAHAMAIRHLLARRLTRVGRWRDARAYFPPSLRGSLDLYIAGIRDGSDSSRPPAQRADSLMAAARIAREHGLEILGTELSPDFYCYHGSFVGIRHPSGEPRDRTQALTSPRPDELARFAASATAPDRRFHYRWIAADHAWSAAQLMPDNSDQTAAALYEAGCWIKDSDPASADRFYKALVRRCGSTALGREAEAIRWFPKSSSASLTTPQR